MIHLLHGENDFLKQQKLKQLTQDFKGEVERVDGDELALGRLRELAQGQTLFSDSRLVVISDLSLSPAWQDAPGILKDASASLVLVEKKLDKRTKTYKWLKQYGVAEEFVAFGERDGGRVSSWAVKRAKDYHGFELSPGLARVIIERVGHDQLMIDKLLEQLSLAEKVDQKTVDALVPLPRTENVFELFEAALKGQAERVQQIIGYLELESGDDGAYQTLGLIVSQLVPLNALVLGGTPGDVTKDFSTHPFVVQKLAPYARKLELEQLGRMNQTLAKADVAMKTTSVSPWLLLEAVLVKIGQIAK